MKTPQRNPEPLAKDALETAGGEVAAGILVELVASETGQKRLELLFFNGEKAFRPTDNNVLTEIYRPVAIPPSVLQAIHFPTQAAEAAKDAELLTAIIGTLRPFVEVEECILHGIAVWCITTWIADFLAAPVALSVSGDFSHAMSLFAGLGLCSRRALALADVDRVSLRNLPWQIAPTLLINGAMCSRKTLATLINTNVPGFFVAGPRSSVLNLAAPRAIYIVEDEAMDDRAENVVRVHLPPRRTQGDYVRPYDLQEQKSKLQRAALAYRFHFWRDHRGLSAIPRPAHPTLKDLFLSAIPNQEGHQNNLLAFLEGQDYGARERALVDPDRALVEVIWGPAHECKELAVALVTDRLNALLRSRGESKIFNAVEVGCRLRKLSIARRRGQNANLVAANRATIEHLHDLAVRFALQLPNHKSSCVTCASEVSKVGLDTQGM